MMTYDHIPAAGPDPERMSGKQQTGETGIAYKVQDKRKNLEGEDKIHAAAEEDWLWLCSIQELTWKERMTLLHCFGSPGAVRTAAPDDFGDWDKLGLKWVGRVRKAMSADFLDRIKEEMDRNRICFVSRDHPDFPTRLRSLPDCPHGIFFRGRLPREDVLPLPLWGPGHVPHTEE